MDYSNLEEVIASYSFAITGFSSLILIALVSIAVVAKKQSALIKSVLFLSIALTTVATTIFLAGSTIYLNVNSISGGPVHYHADIEVWNCGEELNLIDPKGISNKIGTSILHEHNDKRIHLEGVVVEERDASLGKFMKVIGGEISDNTLVFPTNSGTKSFVSGQMCPNGEEAFVQVFAYNVDGGNYTQRKITNPHDYIIASHSQVPPGDCIIIEFDKYKEKTDKLCLSFEVAKQIGKLGEEK